MNREPATLAHRLARTRNQTLSLCETLQAEDMVVQSSDDASPIKWHLAHTTWFFEEFILGSDASYRPYREGWSYLFNSYYQTVGPVHARAKRGLLTRPSTAEVIAYRHAIDERLQRLLERDVPPDTAALIELGINHEQQHQELILTDAKVMLWSQPTHPAFRRRPAGPTPTHRPPNLRFIRGAEGVATVGSRGDGFAFDNERPAHKTFLPPHGLASRLTTNSEFSEFIRDRGYERPNLWLAEGWNAVQSRKWQRPMYWHESGELEYTLDGMAELDMAAPVCHVSFFEADAFARWAQARLPTEFEWESASRGASTSAGNFVESGAFRPLAARPATEGLSQLFGDVWEWTSSPYVSYPGYRTPEGAIGEYNGKFMSSQWVLRGGSCVTPESHIRATYRNFFYPVDRWQFSGIRLAVDA